MVQGLKYIHDADLAYGDLKGVRVPVPFLNAQCTDVEKANILIKNEEPPRACLADFGFMTMVLGPDHSTSVHAVAEGGTFSFMAPELLAPVNFGLESLISTREADVFAFGLVVLQVFHLYCPWFSHVPAHSCRFSQGNPRSITLQSTNAYMQSSRVCGQRDLRTLRLSDFQVLCGSSSRPAGVKKGHSGQVLVLLWMLFATRLRNGIFPCHHLVRRMARIHLPYNQMSCLISVTV